MWFRPGLHCFSEKLIFLRYGQIRPQLGRLLGIEFVRFRDLLIEDVRIAVVSTSAWLNAYRRSSDSRSFAGAWSPDQGGSRGIGNSRPWPSL
ncbi:hypothetical protein CN163_24115 [Sinorhizobium meliloti]|nr:hypothetical protein CN163_24115 [Sinorhizobium meliloti]